MSLVHKNETKVSIEFCIVLFAEFIFHGNCLMHLQIVLVL